MALTQYRIGGTFYGYDTKTKELVAFPSMQSLLQFFPEGLDDDAPTLPISPNDGLLVTANQQSGQLISAKTLTPVEDQPAPAPTPAPTPEPTPEPAPTPPPTAPAPTPQQPISGNLTDSVFKDNALLQTYNERSDLQELYNPPKPNGEGGEAKDPTDPRVANIPTLTDWAQQFGFDEVPNLAGFGPGATAPTDAAPAETPTDGTFGEPDFTTGVPELDAIYKRLSQFIEDLVASGQTINPNIELTPETIQGFLDQATAEIGPFFANQIELVREDLDRAIGDLQRTFEFEKTRAESIFKQNLAVQGERFAGAGTIISGQRGREQQELVQGQQRSLDFATESAASAAAQATAGAEAAIGTRNLAGLNLPGFQLSQVSLAGRGGFTAGDRRLSFFDPTGRDVTGSLEFQERADIRSLADFLKQQEIQKRVLSFEG